MPGNEPNTIADRSMPMAWRYIGWAVVTSTAEHRLALNNLTSAFAFASGEHARQIMHHAKELEPRPLKYFLNLFILILIMSIGSCDMTCLDHTLSTIGIIMFRPIQIWTPSSSLHWYCYQYLATDDYGQIFPWEALPNHKTLRYCPIFRDLEFGVAMSHHIAHIHMSIPLADPDSMFSGQRRCWWETAPHTHSKHSVYYSHSQTLQSPLLIFNSSHTWDYEGYFNPTDTYGTIWHVLTVMSLIPGVWVSFFA